MLRKPWLWTLLGAFLVGLAIWLLGDRLIVADQAPLASRAHRALAIAGLALVWGALQISVAVLRRGRVPVSSPRMAESVLGRADHARALCSEERERLHAGLAEAMTRARGDGVRSALGRRRDALPRYLIIGAPDSGKTAALLASGLSSPDDPACGEGSEHGARPTRTCVWRLCPEAMVVDPPGRYATQDSYEAVDRCGWESLLALLAARRPQRPLNGVLVAVSPAELLQLPPTKREALASALGARLRELAEALGARVPFYVLLTKADLITGFTELFEALGDDACKQVVGARCSGDPAEPGSGAVSDLLDGLADLQQQLSRRVFSRLEREPDPQRCATILAFPQQLAALRAPLGALLHGLVGSDDRTAPMLRGLYVSSAVQTGAPIDRALAPLAASCGIAKAEREPAAAGGRSYFLARLFHDVLLPDADLAGRASAPVGRPGPRRTAVLAVSAVACALMAALWASSYLDARERMRAVEQAMQRLSVELRAVDPGERAPIALLGLLEQAAALPRSAAPHSPPARWLSQVGLDLHSRLLPAAETAYHRVLRRALLPAVIHRLEDQIRRAGSSQGLLRDALAVYLQLGEPTHYDAEAVRYWVGRDWDSGLQRAALSDQQREAFKDHLHTLLAQYPGPLAAPLDAALIAQARESLTRIPLADRLYARLRQEGLGAGFADFAISEAAGDYARLVFERRSGRGLSEGISSLYTADGYRNGFDTKLEQLIADASRESWILDADTSIEGLVRAGSEVRLRYLRDYASEWERLLDDIDLAAPRDLRHAAEIARVLSDPEQSPLRRLLLAVMSQTGLSEGAALATAAQELPSGLSLVPGDYVARRFHWLPTCMQPDASGKAPFDQAQRALERTSLLLESMAAAASSGRGALAAGALPALDELKRAADDLPPPLARFFVRLAEDSASVVSDGMRAHLGRIWTAEVLPFCREAIQDRYPLAADSQRDVVVHDFGRFFAAGGLLDAFFSTHFSALVDASTRPWRWKEGEDVFPSELLAQFERADRIRRAFFRDRDSLPQVELEVIVPSLDAQARELTLDVDGQTLVYRGDVAASRRLAWPGGRAPSGARIELVDGLGMTHGKAFSGPWSWLRLFEDAQQEATESPGRYRLIFELDGRAVELVLHQGSVLDPSTIEALRGFHCPDRI